MAGCIAHLILHVVSCLAFLILHIVSCLAHLIILHVVSYLAHLILHIVSCLAHLILLHVVSYLAHLILHIVSCLAHLILLHVVSYLAHLILHSHLWPENDKILIKKKNHVDMSIYRWVSAILTAILNFSNSSMVTEWHPVDYQSGPFKDWKSTENNYASQNSRSYE